MAETAQPQDPSGPAADLNATMLNMRFVALLLIAAGIGVVASLAAWGFLELVYLMQHGIFFDLPKELGYDNGAPLWWSLPVCGVVGLSVALAVTKLPGNGGHIPAFGLVTGGPRLPQENCRASCSLPLPPSASGWFSGQKRHFSHSAAGSESWLSGLRTRMHRRR